METEKLRDWLVVRSGECQLVGNGFDQCLTLLDELERLQKENGAMREALKECADDLEAEINARAAGELPRRIARDMAAVQRARTALKEDTHG